MKMTRTPAKGGHYSNKDGKGMKTGSSRKASKPKDCHLTKSKERYTR